MASQSVRPAFRNNSEALARATTGLSMSNYPTIYGGFKEKGIPESEIKPRENVFTHSAQKCYLCLRYVVSPMSPGWTRVLWCARRDSNSRPSGS